MYILGDCRPVKAQYDQWYQVEQFSSALTARHRVIRCNLHPKTG